MHVETASWAPATGWAPALPAADGRSTLVLVFGCHPDADALNEPMAELSAAFADQVVLGCSTPAQLDAEHSSSTVVAPSGVALSVTVARFDRTTLRHCHVDVARAGGARSAGRAVADAMDTTGLRAVIVLGDGHVANGGALAAGFAERLPGVSLAGGFAGEGLRDASAPTWTVVDGACVSGHVGAVGLVGEHIELGFGAAGGWDVFGPERLVTQSYGNVLYELDGRPALSLYRDYLGDDDLAAFPMSIRDLDDRTVVRTVWSVNPATDSLRLGGDVPQGAVAQLLQSSPDHLVEGAHLAAQQAAIGHEQLAIAISCVGRLIVLGERIGEELDAAREALDAHVHVSGFYSVGSLAPTLAGSDLNNQVMTITTVREHGDPVSA